MAEFLQKIDSNATGLLFAEEDRTKKIGTLPDAADQVWYPLEPNSYTDFGAPTKTVARQPISASRQIRKGTLVDFDPAGGLQNDFTQDGLNRSLQGFFFASMRESFDTQGYNTTRAAVTAVVGASHKYKLAYGDDVASVLASMLLKASGFTATANNGLKDVSSATATAASGVLTSSANYTDADTVTIGSNVYTLQSALTNVAGHVKIGASEAATIANLHHAINGSGGVAGTDYALATVAHPDVTAADNASHTVTVTAKRSGYAANSIVTTEASATASWGAATLVGGVADVVVTDTGVVDESPSATARLEVVGYQGASADLTITNSGTDLPVLGSSSLDFTTLPLIPGQWLWIGGDTLASEFATATDNGWARMRSITSHAITFDKTSATMVTDAGTGKTVQLFWGKVLKNESDPANQVRRTYTFERRLGQPDLSNPTKPQAEYLKGAVSNELTFNLTTADKATVDMSWMAVDYDTLTSADTILSQAIGATVLSVLQEDAFNTSSNVSRARMTILSDTDANPDALFAEVTDVKFMIKNNLKGNKSLGKLGPFELTAGFFEGSGNVSAYFNTVDAIQAVRSNADVTLDVALARNNAGVLFDLCLLTLQSKGLDVKINEPVMMPIDASFGADRNFDHTVLFSFFSYLPDAAMP